MEEFEGELCSPIMTVEEVYYDMPTFMELTCTHEMFAGFWALAELPSEQEWKEMEKKVELGILMSETIKRVKSINKM